jgi:hypothetical protein
MVAEDLRIGNWVHQGDGFPMQIVAIFQDEVYLNFEGNEGDVWECKIADLKGFEANTEWLDTLGYKLSENKTCIVKGNFTYSIELGVLYWRMEAIEPKLTKYVHQIQNLHLALAGQKL